MAEALKRITGKATITGTSIITVPTGSTFTVIGLRGSNNDTTAHHWVHFEINGNLVCGAETPLPVGSAIDVMEGSKIVAQADDVITAYSDADNVVDVYISYLEQS